MWSIRSSSLVSPLITSGSAPRRRKTSIRADRAQRIPDLVRDPGGEPPYARQFLRADQLALGVEQVVGHPVQALRQRGEIPGLGIRRARVEISVRNGVRRRHEALEWSQHEACDEV